MIKSGSLKKSEHLPCIESIKFANLFLGEAEMARPLARRVNGTITLILCKEIGFMWIEIT